VPLNLHSYPTIVPSGSKLKGGSAGGGSAEKLTRTVPLGFPSSGTLQATGTVRFRFSPSIADCPPADIKKRLCAGICGEPRLARVSECERWQTVFAGVPTRIVRGGLPTACRVLPQAKEACPTRKADLLTPVTSSFHEG
jgi:hypothetical protein